MDFQRHLSLCEDLYQHIWGRFRSAIFNCDREHDSDVHWTGDHRRSANCQFSCDDFCVKLDTSCGGHRFDDPNVVCCVYGWRIPRCRLRPDHVVGHSCDRSLHFESEVHVKPHRTADFLHLCCVICFRTAFRNMGLDRWNSDFHFLIECVGDRTVSGPASEIAYESATAAQER